MTWYTVTVFVRYSDYMAKWHGIQLLCLLGIVITWQGDMVRSYCVCWIQWLHGKVTWYTVTVFVRYSDYMAKWHGTQLLRLLGIVITWQGDMVRSYCVCWIQWLHGKVTWYTVTVFVRYSDYMARWHGIQLLCSLGTVITWQSDMVYSYCVC